MATRKVYAVKGRLFSLPGRRGHFVGYERLPGGTSGADIVIPDGSAYKLRPDGEDVPNTVDVRKAIACGDISERPEPLTVSSDLAGVAGDEGRS